MFICNSHFSPSSLPLISNCRTLQQVNQLHAHFITTGLISSPSLSTQIILSLLSSPRPPFHLLARRIFFSSDLRNGNPTDPFLWNAVIKSFSHGTDPFSAIITFAFMFYSHVFADKFSFSLALKACARTSSLSEGAQIHSLMQKSHLASNLYLQNNLIAFYSKCGQFEIARKLFDRMPHRDSVSWNSMIDGYVKSGMLGFARELFDGVSEEDRNSVTWNTMIGGYAAQGDGWIDVARCLFDRMPTRESVSWNLMIDGYAKCSRMNDAVNLFDQMPHKDVISWANLIAGYMAVGRIDAALQLFNEMPEKDVVTWNIVMAGYVKNGRFVEALHLFYEMTADRRLSPDNATLATTLSAVSELGRVREGIAIHRYIKQNHLSLDGKLGVGLIDMYSKCGRLHDALKVFQTCGESVDHWNAMIGGLAVHGLGELALRLFQRMDKLSLKPDDITFIGVLNACSHSGLVEDGLECFEIMRRDYKLEPKMQHYGCMVDILGRAGRLEDAWKLINEMPFEPNDIVWRSLLSACKKHGKFEMGLKVSRFLTEGSSCTSSSYILLSNIYAGVGMWRDAKNVRMMMKERAVRKIPGCSWIELDGEMHEFVVGENSQPRAEEAYSLLEELCKSKLCSSQDLYSVQHR